MTTPIESFNRKECELIPGIKINAYTDLYLDPENPTGIILDTTWGVSKVDLKSVVKAGETVTHLYLAPENAPEGLCYEKEDGTTDYIPGDELSRIISMRLLKDVNQTKPISGGGVYMFNSTTNLFEPFALQTFVNETNQHLTNIDNTLTNLQSQITALGTRVASLENRMVTAEANITNLQGRVSDIEGLIYNYPADKTTKIPRGNINIISDYTNSDNRNWGIFTHSTSNIIPNDEFFS